MTAAAPPREYKALVNDYFVFRLITGVASVDGSTATTTDDFEVRHRADIVSVLSASWGYGWADRGIPIRTEIEFLHRIRFDYDTRVNSSPVVGYEVNLRGDALMFNGIYDFELPRGIGGYLGAGIGYARNVADVERQVLGINDVRHWSYQTNNLAWSVMAGFMTRVTDKLWLEIGYRYSDLGRVDQGTDPGGVAVNAESYISHDFVLGFLVNF